MENHPKLDDILDSYWGWASTYLQYPIFGLVGITKIGNCLSKIDFTQFKVGENRII